MTRNPPTYRRIVTDIRRRIAAGELPPGSLLPTRRELRRTYQVSRQPIEAAMVILRTQGLVIGEPGKGVFVTAAAPKIARTR